MSPTALAEAHMECRSLAETVPVLTDFLALHQVDRASDTAVMRHPNTGWTLFVHEAGPEATPKEMHNHYGVRVQTKGEVDAAHAYLMAHKDEYGISDVSEPEFSHGSYSVYLREPGTNGLEIECYEAVLQKESGGTRLGGVRSNHWDTPLDASWFPGRGYVPQALTHGTLACGDVAASKRFYADVLGLEVHDAYGDRVVYIKHPARKHFIVCARRSEFQTHTPNFRFTLTLGSAAEVRAAHDRLATAPEVGVTELRAMQTENGRTFFFVSDPDKNWWEIAASDSRTSSSA